MQGACKAHRPQLQANMSLVRSSDRGPAVQRAFGIYLCDCRHQAAAKQVDKGQDWLCCAPGRIPKCIRRQHALSGHDRANPAIVSRTGSHTEGYGQSSRRQSARDAAATSLCSVVSFESTSSPCADNAVHQSINYAISNAITATVGGDYVRLYSSSHRPDRSQVSPPSSKLSSSSRSSMAPSTTYVRRPYAFELCSDMSFDPFSASRVLRSVRTYGRRSPVSLIWQIGY